MKSDLAQIFREAFHVDTVDSPRLRRDAYALRYQIYCLETGFEDATQFPEGLEYDIDDERSTHAVIYSRDDQEPAATVRLILPDLHNLTNPLPIERHCQLPEHAGPLDLATLDRRRLAEISRFAVAARFRRRAGDIGTLAGGDQAVVDAPGQGKYRSRLFPQLTLGLFVAIFRMSREHGITHLYAVMEPALLRLLSRFGIHFHKLGDCVDYHGLRQPCLGVVEEMAASVKEERREIWEFVNFMCQEDLSCRHHLERWRLYG